MKKLGLIGGTGPESTIIYYKELTSGVQKRLQQNVFPHLTIESLSVFEVFDFCERKDYAGLAAYLAAGLKNLAAAGAELAAFTGMTPHIVLEEVEKRSPLPIIGIPQAAADFAAREGYRRVALLGTRTTMAADFAKAPFRAAGIEVIMPNAEEREYIGEKIATEVELGIIKEETQARFKEISLRLIEKEHADALILGCTELPLIFDGLSLPAPKLDVMRIHIDTLIDRIVEG